MLLAATTSPVFIFFCESHLVFNLFSIQRALLLSVIIIIIITVVKDEFIARRRHDHHAIIANI